MNNSNPVQRTKNVLSVIVKELVDKPELVSVEDLTSNRMTVLTVHADKKDIGKIIGKQGKTAQSIRQLLEAIARKHGTRVVFEIDDGGNNA